MFTDNKTALCHLSNRIGAILITLFVAILMPTQSMAAAETCVATGTVLDTDEEPLPGVTIREKGTTNAVASDIDGHFSITVPKGSEIEFSYIGKETYTLKIDTSKSYTITLYDTEQRLDEVMVTGYATVSKAQSTGSFQKLSTETLERRRMDNLESMLEGNVVGYVDGKIRGITTMNAVANPLIVIDGFPVENTQIDRMGQTTEEIPNLNPEDIESITVLKDAAAASIYGARAANGVIVITTKKAQQGKPEVSFSATFTSSPYSHYHKNLTNAADVIELERRWAAQSPSLLAGGQSAIALAEDLRYNGAIPSLGVNTLLDMYSGVIGMDEGNKRLDALAKYGYQYYKQAEKYGKRNPFHQQYNLRLAQSSERNSFNMSTTYWDHKYEDVNHGDRKFGINITDQLKVTDWLTADMGIYLNYGRDIQQYYDPFNPGFNALPYDALVDADGRPLAAVSQINGARREAIEANGMIPEILTPLDEIDYQTAKGKSLETRSFAKLRFDIMPWLKYSVQFQYETSNYDTEYLQDRYSYDVVGRLNNFVSKGYGGLVYNLPEGDIMYKTSTRKRGYNFRQQLNFDKTFAERHRVLVFIGQELRDMRITYNDNTYFGYDPELLTWKPWDQNALGYFSGILGMAQLQTSTLESMKEMSNRFVSFYGNASYSLDEKYNFTGSLRWDRSNLWGTSSKFQNKPIWSVGASWNLNREEWLRNTSWLNQLQLRASYGIGGNIGRNTAPYMTAGYGPGQFGTMGWVIAPPNKDIRWEKTRTINVCVDFNLFTNRLWGTIDYYHKKSTDLLAMINGSPTQGFGYSVLTTNNGSMVNQGLELSLSGHVIRKADLLWTASLLYSVNKNKVTHVSMEPVNYDNRLMFPTSYPTVGNPYFGLYAYRYAGLDENGDPMVLDAEGNPTSNDVRDADAIVFQGTTMPVHSGSFTNTVRWRDFEFSAMITFAAGHKVRDILPPSISMASGRITATHKDIMNSWKQPGDELHTDVPRLLFSNDLDNYNTYRNNLYAYSDKFVYDASNIRFHNISLSYMLPSAITRAAKMRLVKFRFSVENLATIAMDHKALYSIGGKEKPNFVWGINIGF